MKYNFKEYSTKFETPAKREQERAIANKIMDLLNKNKYDHIDDFMSKNQSYQDFLKKNQMENVIKHFGNTLSEKDYVMIIDRLKQLTTTKKDFDKNSIKTTTIEDKEYVSYKGTNKNYYLDNSSTSKRIEEQLKDIQHTSESFQTNDKKQNTENMFNELEKRKKESLNLRYLNEIDISSLTIDQLELFETANNYQTKSNSPIKLDLDKGVIVDEENTIMKIEKENDKYVVKISENGYTKNENITENKKTHQKQLVLVPRPDTIYSNN